MFESQICDHCYLKRDGTPAALADFSSGQTETPMAQFYPNSELYNDHTNCWVPNQIGLTKMLETSGFESDVHYNDGVRIILHCRKINRRSDASLWAAREWRGVKRRFSRYD